MNIRRKLRCWEVTSLKSPRCLGPCLGLDFQSPVSSSLACSITLSFSLNVDLWLWSCWLIGSNIHSPFHKSCRYFICLYLFIYLFSFSFSPVSSTHYNTLYFYCIFPFFFLSLFFLCKTVSYRECLAFTAKYVLQELQLTCHCCVLFLPYCRLLLLQVMPLSHLHPSHFLLVQTCLVLYLSALLPYPQVRNLLDIWAWLKFGHQFSGQACILVFVINSVQWKWEGFWGQCCRARQNKSLTSWEYII